MQLSYRVRGGVHKMGQGGPHPTGKNLPAQNGKNSTGEWKKIYTAKANIQEEAIRTLGLRLDMPGLLKKLTFLFLIVDATN